LIKKDRQFPAGLIIVCNLPAGQVTGEGKGELVVTGFYNYAMPLIRYRTTDILTIRPCDASSSRRFTRVDRIQGRMNDKIGAPAGREFYFMGDPLFDIPGIFALQRIQHEIDRIRIKNMAGDDFRMDSIARLKKNLRNMFTARSTSMWKSSMSLRSREGVKGQ
jgi:phenylacetate-coenzyme A ligase PaaK-like adenylate-forming protein